MSSLTAPKKAPLSPASVGSWLSDATHNRFVALVLGLVVAVPMLAAPASGLFSGAAALTLEVAALALMAMLLWRARFDFSAQSVRQFLSTGANTPVLLFVGLVALSCALSPMKAISGQQFLCVAAGALLYFVVAYQFRQSKHLSALASTLLAVGGMAAFAGLVQFQIAGGGRAEGLMGNWQTLGSLLMLMLPIVAALAFGDKSPARARVAQFVGVLMVGALLATQVRTAWAGSLAGLVTLAFLMMRPTGSAKRAPLAARKHLLVAPIMVALVAGGFAYTLHTQNAGIGDRAMSLSKLATDNSFSTRVNELWPAAITMFKSSPVFGVGAGLYQVYLGALSNQGAALNGTQLSRGLAMNDQAHNFYLQTLAELGLPGLLCVLALVGSFLAVGIKRVGQMEAGIRRTLLVGSLAATVGFAVDAIGSPSWQYPQVAMFLWLVLGMGTACFRPRLKTVKVEEEVRVPTRRAAWISRPAAIALCLGAAMMLPSAGAFAQTDYDDDDDDDDDDYLKYGAIALSIGAVLAFTDLASQGAAEAPAQ